MSTSAPPALAPLYYSTVVSGVEVEARVSADGRSGRLALDSRSGPNRCRAVQWIRLGQCSGHGSGCGCRLGSFMVAQTVSGTGSGGLGALGVWVLGGRGGSSASQKLQNEISYSYRLHTYTVHVGGVTHSSSIYLLFFAFWSDRISLQDTRARLDVDLSFSTVFTIFLSANGHSGAVRRTDARKIFLVRKS